MNILSLSAGPKFPDTIYVIIEIPAQSEPVKYEFDKDSGALMVDRFVQTPMFYPCHYGFVPQTLGGDGDPLDVLVWAPYQLVPGCVIRARVIGGMDMEDESGHDLKLIAVPDRKTSTEFDQYQELEDLPPTVLAKITHFFEHYKDLEPHKWVKVRQKINAAQARQILESSLVSDH